MTVPWAITKTNNVNTAPYNLEGVNLTAPETFISASLLNLGQHIPDQETIDEMEKQDPASEQLNPGLPYGVDLPHQRLRLYGDKMSDPIRDIFNKRFFKGKMVAGDDFHIYGSEDMNAFKKLPRRMKQNSLRLGAALHVHKLHKVSAAAFPDIEMVRGLRTIRTYISSQPSRSEAIAEAWEAAGGQDPHGDPWRYRMYSIAFAKAARSIHGPGITDTVTTKPSIWRNRDISQWNDLAWSSFADYVIEMGEKTRVGHVVPGTFNNGLFLSSYWLDFYKDELKDWNPDIVKSITTLIDSGRYSQSSSFENILSLGALDPGLRTEGYDVFVQRLSAPKVVVDTPSSWDLDIDQYIRDRSLAGSPFFNEGLAKELAESLPKPSYDLTAVDGKETEYKLIAHQIATDLSYSANVKELVKKIKFKVPRKLLDGEFGIGYHRSPTTFPRPPGGNQSESEINKFPGETLEEAIQRLLGGTIKGSKLSDRLEAGANEVAIVERIGDELIAVEEVSSVVENSAVSSEKLAQEVGLRVSRAAMAVPEIVSVAQEIGVIGAEGGLAGMGMAEGISAQSFAVAQASAEATREAEENKQAYGAAARAIERSAAKAAAAAPEDSGIDASLITTGSSGLMAGLEGQMKLAFDEVTVMVAKAVLGPIYDTLDDLFVDSREVTEFHDKLMDIDGDGILEHVSSYVAFASARNRAFTVKDSDDVFSLILRALHPSHPSETATAKYTDDEYGRIWTRFWSDRAVPNIQEDPTAQGELANIFLDRDIKTLDKIRRTWDFFNRKNKEGNSGFYIGSRIWAYWSPGVRSEVTVEFQFMGKDRGKLWVIGDIDHDGLSETYELNGEDGPNGTPDAAFFDLIIDEGLWCHSDKEFPQYCRKEFSGIKQRVDAPVPSHGDDVDRLSPWMLKRLGIDTWAKYYRYYWNLQNKVNHGSLSYGPKPTEDFKNVLGFKNFLEVLKDH